MLSRDVRKSFVRASRQCDMSQWQNPSVQQTRDGWAAARFRVHCSVNFATEITAHGRVIAVRWQTAANCRRVVPVATTPSQGRQAVDQHDSAIYSEDRNSRIP